jgi:hypothetical protein
MLIVMLLRRKGKKFLSALLVATCLVVLRSPMIASAAGKGGDAEQGDGAEAGGAPRLGVGRVDCARVVSLADQEVVDAGQSADVSVLAKRLGTNVIWIERCLQSYGRRVKRPGYESAESREYHLDLFEGDEPEETFAEDKEEPGASARKERPQKQLRPKDYYRFDQEQELEGEQ